VKAIGFFFAIFFSMLAVFLVATGEVKRWFSDPPRSPLQLAEVGGEEKRRPDGQNLLEFDFYDVDAGRRSFSIRAYLRQEDFRVESKTIDQIRELTLQDGTLEVPLAEGSVLSAAEESSPAAGDAASDAPRKVVLHFKSALYTRGDAGENGDFVVLLREGKGVMDDGTEFFFDDLRFAKEPEPAGGAKQGTGFLLTSDRRVAIRGKALELSSPAGFDGILKGTGIETFNFHPPVAALIDPRERSALKLESAIAVDLEAAPREGAELPPGTPPAVEREPVDGGTNQGEKIAVTCQGPLSLTMEKRDDEATPPRPPTTFIRFQKDVKVFVVGAGVSVDSLPAADTSRMECQHLQFELERTEEQLLPRRAVATGAVDAGAAASPAPGGGGVKITIEKDGGAPYTIEGARLEWLLRDAGDAASGVRTSEATLSPRPTLRGEGVEFVAERATFRLPENRLLLETVEGTIRRAPGAEKEQKQTRDRTSPLLRLDALAEAGAGPGREDGGAEKRDEKPRSSLPAVWDVKADEAEFLFTGSAADVPGSAAGQRAAGSSAGPPRGLSRIIARSRVPGGVEIRSRPEDPAAVPPPEVAAGTAAANEPFLVTCDVLTYAEAEKKATLEGSPARKPRFERGSNRIEARRMDVHLEEGVAIFEEEVAGRLEDLKGMRGVRAKEEGAAEGGAAGGKARGEEAAGPDIEAIDVESAFLALQFKDGKDILGLLARGAPDRPARVTAHSADGHSYRLLGPQLHWDQEAEVAQLYRLSADSPEDRSALDPGANAPRLEYDGGDVRAERIRFDRKTWSANLTEGVLARVKGKSGGAPPGPEGPPELEIAAGAADMEFYPDFERLGPQSGSLQALSSVKSLRAHRAPGELILIRTPHFTARTEELTWDAAARRLRFQGNGLQEIEIARDDFQGPITAREVIFDEEKKLLILQGGVQGRLVQARIDAASDAARGSQRSSLEPAALGGRGEHALVWHFTTNVLEIQLEEGPQGRGFELVSVRARDKVHLRNEEYGLQLLGDDLTYEEATRKVHVFSPDGRPQTLLCDRSAARAPADGAAGRGNDTGPEETHKVVSQEIWALLQENPHALAARGEPREWLIVSFHHDVIGSFHLPPQEKGGALGAGDNLKMVAQRLTLYIDPAQPRDPGDPAASRRMIPWAVAVGNVDFSSGTLRATADRAVFEEPAGRLTLFGSPARLSRENKRVFEDPEIAIRRAAGNVDFEVEYRGTPRPERAVLPDSPDRR
jgi:hypothetical protein